MRDLITLLDNLLIETQIFENDAELKSMKAVIANKIKSLPDDDATVKALREIEDLLAHVHAGGKMGIINGELNKIDDPTVRAAHKMLARYILSLDMTPQQREEFFKLWRNDKLVNRQKLLTIGKTDFTQIINKYNNNPVIKEFVDDMMKVSELGQGKGEFGLSVLSKNINKQVGKGDLSIDGRPIEVKTTFGGAGRFTDQEVRPAAGFEEAARKLAAFVSSYPTNPLDLPKSGLSLNNAVQFGKSLTKDKQKYYSLVENVISLIFGGSKGNKKDLNSIMTAIKSGDPLAALQEYSKASFNYYMSSKKDEGVLYINLTTDPISTIFFKEANDLAKSGLRFHAGSAYITNYADHRAPYPQIKIVDTSQPAGKEDIESDEAQVDPKVAQDEKLPQPGAAPKGIKPKGVAAPKASAAPKKDLGRARR
jgi:hypothetical protein